MYGALAEAIEALIVDLRRRSPQAPVHRA